MDIPTAGRFLGLSKNAAISASLRGEIPRLQFGARVVCPVPALLLMLTGVRDVPVFLRELGVGDLPALVDFVTGGAPKQGTR